MALVRIQTRELERRHREGYAKKPVGKESAAEELRRFEGDQESPERTKPAVGLGIRAGDGQSGSSWFGGEW
jgi:hypothetical protein